MTLNRDAKGTKRTQRERWRTHLEHCTSRPCWGPNTCQRCMEINNATQRTENPYPDNANSVQAEDGSQS